MAEELEVQQTDVPAQSNVPEPGAAQPETVEAPKPKSIREEVESAAREVKERKEKPEPKQDAASKPDKPEADKARGADGKFAAKEPEAPAEAASAVKAPTSWTGAAKDKFAALDPEVQKEVLRREEDIHKALTGQEHRYGTETLKVIKPYNQLIREQFGNNPHQAMNDLLSVAHTMRYGTPELKAKLYRELGNQFGIELSANPQAEKSVDPELVALRKQVADLTTHINRETQTKQQAEQQTIHSEIETFSKDPAHPHFDKVRAVMGMLIEKGQAADLQDAYDKAVWADPTIRSTLIDSQVTAAEAKRVADAKAKAEQARNASASIKGSNGYHAPANAPAGSLRDQIKAAMQTVS